MLTPTRFAGSVVAFTLICLSLGADPSYGILRRVHSDWGYFFADPIRTEAAPLTTEGLDPRFLTVKEKQELENQLGIKDLTLFYRWKKQSTNAGGPLKTVILEADLSAFKSQYPKQALKASRVGRSWNFASCFSTPAAPEAAGLESSQVQRLQLQLAELVQAGAPPDAASDTYRFEAGMLDVPLVYLANLGIDASVHNQITSLESVAQLLHQAPSDPERLGRLRKLEQDLSDSQFSRAEEAAREIVANALDSNFIDPHQKAQPASAKVVSVHTNPAQGDFETQDHGIGMNLRKMITKLMTPGDSENNNSFLNSKEAIEGVTGRHGVGFYSSFHYLKEPDDTIEIKTKARTSPDNSPFEGYSIKFYRNANQELIARLQVNPAATEPGTDIKIHSSTIKKAYESQKQKTPDAIVRDRFRYNWRGTILLNGTRIIDPLIEHREIVRSEAGQEGSLIIDRRELPVGATRALVLQVNGVKIKEFPAPATQTYSKVILDFPSQTKVPRDRGTIDFENSESRNYMLAVVKHAMSRHDVTLINSLLPLLGDQGFNLLGELELKFQGPVVPDVPELAHLERIEGKLVARLHRTIYENAKIELEYKGLLPSVGPAVLIAGDFTQSPDQVELPSTDGPYQVIVSSQIDTHSPLVPRILNSIYEQYKRLNPIESRGVPFNLRAYQTDEKVPEIAETRHVQSHEKFDSNSSETTQALQKWAASLNGRGIFEQTFLDPQTKQLLPQFRTSFVEITKILFEIKKEYPDLARKFDEEKRSTVFRMHILYIISVKNGIALTPKELEERIKKYSIVYKNRVLELCKFYELSDRAEIEIPKISPAASKEFFKLIDADSDTGDSYKRFTPENRPHTPPDFDRLEKEYFYFKELVKHYKKSGLQRSDLFDPNGPFGVRNILNFNKLSWERLYKVQEFVLRDQTLFASIRQSSKEDLLAFVLSFSMLHPEGPILKSDLEKHVPLFNFGVSPVVQGPKYQKRYGAINQVFVSFLKGLSQDDIKNFARPIQFLDRLYERLITMSGFGANPDSCKAFLEIAFEKLKAGGRSGTEAWLLKISKIIDKIMTSRSEFEGKMYQDPDHLFEKMSRLDILTPDTLDILYPFIYGGVEAPLQRETAFIGDELQISHPLQPFAENPHVKKIMGSNTGLVNKSVLQAVQQNPNRFFWLKEWMKNAKEAGAKNVYMNIFTDRHDHLWVKFGDDGNGISPTNSKALYIPGITTKNQSPTAEEPQAQEQSSLLSRIKSWRKSNPGSNRIPLQVIQDKNYGWGFYSGLLFFDELAVVSSSSPDSQVVIHLKKDGDSMLISDTTESRKGHEAPFKKGTTIYGRKNEVPTASSLLDLKVNFIRYAAGIQQSDGTPIHKTFNEKSLAEMNLKAPELLASAPLSVSGASQPVAEVQVYQTQEAGLFYNGSLTSQNVAPYLSHIPEAAFELSKKMTCPMAIHLNGSIRQTMNRSEDLVDDDEIKEQIEATWGRAALAGFAKELGANANFFHFPYDFYYELDLDFKPSTPLHKEYRISDLTSKNAIQDYFYQTPLFAGGPNVLELRNEIKSYLTQQGVLDAHHSYVLNASFDPIQLRARFSRPEYRSLVDKFADSIATHIKRMGDQKNRLPLDHDTHFKSAEDFSVREIPAAFQAKAELLKKISDYVSEEIRRIYHREMEVKFYQTPDFSAAHAMQGGSYIAFNLAEPFLSDFEAFFANPDQQLDFKVHLMTDVAHELVHTLETEGQETHNERFMHAHKELIQKLLPRKANSH